MSNNLLKALTLLSCMMIVTFHSRTEARSLADAELFQGSQAASHAIDVSLGEDEENEEPIKRDVPTRAMTIFEHCLMHPFDIRCRRTPRVNTKIKIIDM